MARFVSTVYATHTSVGSYFFIIGYLGLTPKAIICHPRKRGFKSTARHWRARNKCFLTACGRVKSGLKPAVKNRAAHGGEDCAARRVKTKADALVIGKQTPICRIFGCNADFYTFSNVKEIANH